MAYKRELIVNNSSLTSYKKLLKVSDVCQLLDKSTFGTLSGSGITATYNNDGTFTVSGAATESRWWNFPIFQLRPGGGEHVYLFDVGGISNDSNCYCNIYFYDEITDRAVELMQTGRVDSAVIKKLESPTVYQARFNITTLTGATPNNVVYKPQLFDLTEMYGAGNEPKTVAEFRAKFPNELYPYSPRCWVTSYKTGLIAKTKNLFDWSGKLRQYYDTANCTIVETLTNGAILQGHIGSEPGNASYDNGWFRPGAIDGYGTAVTLSANDVVTISADYEILESNYASPMPIGVYLYGTEQLATQRSQIETGVLYRIKGTYTITKDGQYYPVFTLNSSKVKITNIQIEKGRTATDYVPYGYL